MPEHNQPWSLRNMLIERVAQITFHSCVAIEGRHERFKWSSSLQREVSDLQEFLLSYISPLWDEICEVIVREEYIARDGFGKRLVKPLFHFHNKIHDLRIMPLLLICEQMRKFFLPITRQSFLEPVCLSESQIAKFKNVVELQIRNVKLTDKMFEIMAHTCRDLKKVHVTCDSRYTTLESLCTFLLTCRELEYVEIEFKGWDPKVYEPYVLKLLVQLPKLKTFFSLYPGISEVLPKLTSDTPLKSLYCLNVSQGTEMENIIRKCPHVQHIHMTIRSETYEERQKVLNGLAESSLQMTTLDISKFAFGKSMDHLLEQKGRYITKLILDQCEGSDASLNNIYTIGVNCPALVELSITERTFGSNYTHPSFQSPVIEPETLIATTPPMFPKLGLLRLSARNRWDIRLLLQILFHANRLKQIHVGNIYPRGFHNLLAEILNVNSFTDLEQIGLSLTISSGMEVTPLISRGSIQRLLVSCPKLNYLNLLLPMDLDAYFFMEDLDFKVKNENLNLELTYVEPPELLVDFEDLENEDDFEDSENEDDFEDSENEDDFENL